jgi:uncharacterized double-CXXCG motif protein
MGKIVRSPRMRYLVVEADKSSEYTGFVNGAHKWGLPGVDTCPACKSTWASTSRTYPSVDLTPLAPFSEFESPGAVPIEEYERLCGLVRPLLPPGAVLQPGCELGPLVGSAQGRFGTLVRLHPRMLLVQREAFEKLQAEDLHGLRASPAQLRFRQRNPPELLELELLPVGRVYADCLPPKRKPPCSRCGRLGLTLPDDLVLDAATLPSDLDVFRLEDFSVVTCPQRFAEACKRLGLDGVVFHPVPVSGTREGKSARSG